MPIRVGDILTRASITLNDEDFVRWTKAELYGWVNDGACEIVLRRPAARAVTTTFELIAGTFQRVSEGALLLLDITRSVKPDGSAWRSIRRVDRQLLDDQQPDWHALKQSLMIKHFIYDEATPATFYVYPPASPGAKVEAIISEAPPYIAGDNDIVQLDRSYIGPLTSYVMYRCLAKDSEFANAAMATAHFQAFTEALGVQNAVTNEASPNVRVV